MENPEALSKAVELIESLTVDDFEFKEENFIKAFSPKEIINSAKKIKKYNGETVIRVYISNNVSYNFINFKNSVIFLDISEGTFNNFVSKFQQYDEIEEEQNYFKAVLKRNVSDEIYTVCKDLFSNYYLTRFSIETIGLTCYGYADYSIPYIKSNNIIYKRELLLSDIKNYLQQTIFTLYDWSKQEVAAW